MCETGLLTGLGKAIKAKRLELGYSQEELAAKACIHRTYMGAIERGERNVGFNNLCKIADALSTNLSVIIINAEKHCS